MRTYVIQLERQLYRISYDRPPRKVVDYAHRGRQEGGSRRHHTGSQISKNTHGAFSSRLRQPQAQPQQIDRSVEKGWYSWLVILSEHVLRIFTNSQPGDRGYYLLDLFLRAPQRPGCRSAHRGQRQAQRLPPLRCRLDIGGWIFSTIHDRIRDTGRRAFCILYFVYQEQVYPLVNSSMFCCTLSNLCTNLTSKLCSVMLDSPPVAVRVRCVYQRHCRLQRCTILCGLVRRSCCYLRGCCRDASSPCSVPGSRYLFIVLILIVLIGVSNTPVTPQPRQYQR